MAQLPAPPAYRVSYTGPRTNPPPKTTLTVSYPVSLPILFSSAVGGPVEVRMVQGTFTATIPNDSQQSFIRPFVATIPQGAVVDGDKIQYQNPVVTIK